MEQKLIKYRHKDDVLEEPTFFVAFEEDKVPEWAADVQAYVPDLGSHDYLFQYLNDVIMDDVIFEENDIDAEDKYKDWS